MVHRSVLDHLKGFSDELRVAVEAVTRAGTFLRERQRDRYPYGGDVPEGGFENKHGAHLKPDDTLQLPEDCEAQALIVDRLHAAFPADVIVTEEDAPSDLSAQVLRRVWLVDPLDGTDNYSRGISLYGVSVGLAVGGVVVIGVIGLPGIVYNLTPSTPRPNAPYVAPHQCGLISYAERDKGAFHTPDSETVEPLRVNPWCPYLYWHRYNESTLNRPALVELLKRDPEWSALLYLVEETDTFRRSYGSAVLHQQTMAKGLGGAYFTETSTPWDIAAGALIIEEAGGRVTNWRGESRSPLSWDSYLATNSVMHDRMLRCLHRLVDYLRVL